MSAREMESDVQYMVNRALAGMRRKKPAPCKPERPACKVIPFPMGGRDGRIEALNRQGLISSVDR